MSRPQLSMNFSLKLLVGFVYYAPVPECLGIGDRVILAYRGLGRIIPVA